MTRLVTRYLITFAFVAVCVLVFWAVSADTHGAYAQGGETENPQSDDGSGYCLLCHADSEQVFTFMDGSTIPLGISPAGMQASVHGANNPQGELSCMDCHNEKTYPHNRMTLPDVRSYRVKMAEICIDCHSEQAETLADSVHYEALARGNYRAATCVDCHGAHEVHEPNAKSPITSQTCGNCHQIAFSEYEQSVHGAALLTGDPNVPACVDCHGVHGIQHPTTAQFRNRSPELCAGCHADDELMEEYGISTNVFDSYLSDFHGTTVQIFRQSDPDVATNKAVCFDCHGVHDIAKVDSSNSHVVRANLLETCQQCHPDATSEFPDSWIGHYEPSFESQPVLFSVNVFYAILIPGVLGGFVFLVGTDIYRRVRQRVRKS